MRPSADPSTSVATAASFSSNAEAPFQRLWHGFLTARTLVAFTLLVLHVLAVPLNQASHSRLLVLCFIYLIATALTRIVAAPHPPPPQGDVQWLPLLGVDLLLVGLLQWLQPGNTNYTPLFGIPILMASVLGSLTLALGTTAIATLLMLGMALWRSMTNDSEATGQYMQAALAGTGYFVVAYLTHQLAQRLVREQQLAEQSEKRARKQTQVNALVIENLSDGVLILSHDGRVQAANPAALRLLKEDSTYNKIDTPFLLASQSAWEPLWSMARTTFATEQPQSADVNLTHPGQGPIGLRVRTWLTPSGEYNEERSTAQCVMFLHDLRELQARLRTEKLAAMGRMSAAVAHEIRNPLAAIMQANALLGEDLDDAGQKKLCTMVQQNAERLKKITEEILDIVRVQNQISHTPAASLGLDSTITQIWNDWRLHDPIQRQGILTLNAEETRVEFETEHLRRVLINLLDNALRFMGQANDSLQISTHLNPEGEASVTVWSDGTPLDASVERHLFEPFFSSHSRSSGLGLYICRELCQRYGATITYQRVAQLTGRGEILGNAFTVIFRKKKRPRSISSRDALDIPVV